MSDRLTATPQALLRECYSTLEETRADLVALYFVADPVIVELGLVDAADHAELVRRGVRGLRAERARSAPSDPRGRHDRGRPHAQSPGDRALADGEHRRDRTARRDGKTYYVTVDVSRFREGCGRLLAEVQRIKSEGDYEAAKALFEEHGTHFDPAVRDEIVRRVDALHLPSYTGFVMPELSPVQDEGGQIVDVSVSYPCCLATQMLSYSAQSGAPD